MTISQRKIQSVLGPLYLVASEESLRGVYWKKASVPLEKGSCPNGEILDRAEAQIQEYLKGDRKKFSVPMIPQGTDFQKRVWQALLEIPYGSTRSYKEVACDLEIPQGSRAVGTANGRNPLSILIPCHRLVNVDGGLGGYAGGLKAKAFLLDLESTSSKSR